VSVPCSAGRIALGEPVAGSAPFARLWVMLEQPGPWGRDAVRESHLDASVGEALAALPGERPVRIGLIRSVGAHVDRADHPRTLLIARTDPGAQWLAARRIDDVRSLPQSLDLDALLAAPSPPEQLPGASLPAPPRALLVCTNAKRDQCCAMLGRPLAAFLADRSASASSSGPAVWETSHTSGHRFAPTYVSLPDGYLFGGPDAEHGTVEACRGRSSLQPAAQVAELAVLRELGVRHPRPLDVSALDVSTLDVSTLEVSPLDASTYAVADGDNAFSVTVTPTPGPDRPESCGKPPVRFLRQTATVTPQVR
jgi:hypothetical protein